MQPSLLGEDRRPDLREWWKSGLAFLLRNETASKEVTSPVYVKPSFEGYKQTHMTFTLVDYCLGLLESVPLKLVLLTFFIVLCRSSVMQQRDQWYFQHQECGTAKSLYQNVYGTVCCIVYFSVLCLLESRYSHTSC